MDGNSMRQTKAKTYTSSVDFGRVKGNRELSEDDEATLPNAYKTIRHLSPIVVHTNRQMMCEDDQAAASLTFPRLTEAIGYLDREMGSNLPQAYSKYKRTMKAMAVRRGNTGRKLKDRFWTNHQNDRRIADDDRARWGNAASVTIVAAKGSFVEK